MPTNLGWNGEGKWMGNGEGVGGSMGLGLTGAVWLSAPIWGRQLDSLIAWKLGSLEATLPHLPHLQQLGR